jgi:prepilin-type N-terminal cleavage/methylation domain-containing protein
MHKLLNKKNGMTLIELVIAMAIFAIMAITFISLFTSSVIWIFGAANKGEAYSSAQQDIESRIATKEALYSSDLVITFGSDSYSIQGGLVESDQTVRQRSSQLETFIPLVPTIIINPQVRYEGSNQTFVAATGINTNFNAGTTVELYDKTGTAKIGSTITPSVTNTTTLNFNLPSNLVNSDYIVRVITPITGEPNEIARAKYVLEQPKFMTISNNSIYVSADGENWMNRSSLSDFPAFSGALNSTANNSISYIAVGNGGLVLFSTEKQPWLKRIATSENLLGVAWSTGYSNFYAVGSEGQIYSSSTGSTWSLSYSFAAPEPLDPDDPPSYSLNGIVSTDFTTGSPVLNAVGDRGRVLYSLNGTGWTEVNPSPVSENLYSIASGYNGSSNELIIAVGENGRIIKSTNGVSWTSDTISSLHIYDISYNKSWGMFVAVGENGLIRTSLDGNTWTNLDLGSNDLYGIFAKGNDFIAVGENGTVLYSSNGSTWSYTSGISSVDLKSIVGR